VRSKTITSAYGERTRVSQDTVSSVILCAPSLADRVSAGHNWFNPLEFRGNYSATSNNMKLVHWPMMGGLLHLVYGQGDWAGEAPARPVS